MSLAAGGAESMTLNIRKTAEGLLVGLDARRDFLPGARAGNGHHAHDVQSHDSSGCRENAWRLAVKGC